MRMYSRYGICLFCFICHVSISGMTLSGTLMLRICSIFLGRYTNKFLIYVPVNLLWFYVGTFEWRKTEVVAFDRYAF